MNKRSLSFCLTAVMLLTLMSPTIAQAATLEEIKLQQESKESEIVQLDNQINENLTAINAKNNELEVIQGEMTALEVTIEETAADIKEQKALVTKRLTQAKDRLQTMQTTEVNQNTVLSLIEAESMTDFLNRAYVLITLQSAGNDQIEIAQEEAEELATLEEQQKTDKASLEEKSVLAKEQKEELDTQLASLQKTMDDNKALLDKLDEEKANEENRLAVEKEAAEKAAVVQLLSAKEEEEKSAPVVTQLNTKPEPKEPVASEPVQKTEAKSESKPEPKQEPKKEQKAAPKAETATSSSKSIVVSATGYSTKQPGLSTHTATGIDLRQNPNVIAVDPSVIPLGSTVEVPGVGTFIAGDTGGAINGNKIDIHFTSVQQALSWGRRTIRVNILN